MSDIFDENIDEELEFANKEWNKLNKTLDKDGFRDGIHEGRQIGLQKSFDVGYRLSFAPFLTISSFEAIIDVLIFKLGSDEEKKEMLTQLKEMKSNLKELYHLINTNISAIETYNSNNNILFTNEITDMFNSTKQKSIIICNHLNLDSLSKQINELSILQINC